MGIVQNMIDANDLCDKYQLLCDAEAHGATEDNDPAKVELGYEMFERFRGDRRLRFLSAPGIEMIPWLNKWRIESKKWEENFMFVPPFHDHVRHFIDRDTKERIFTIQPYLGTVARDTGWRTWQKDYSCEQVELPREFVDIYNTHVNSRGHFKPFPDTPLVHDTIQKILDKANDVSRKFAKEHGLHVRVSFDGWYNPQQVILIEYTKA